MKKFLTNAKYPPSFLIIFFLFVVWLLTVKGFLSGHVPVNLDTYTNFALLKYFYNNLLNGTLPLWDPFLYLGRMFIYTGSSTALSPFSLSIPLLSLCGLDFYQAYLVYIVSYYFFGLTGFYLLARKLLKNDFYALIAYALLLFSGLGGVLFNQIFILYIFVPVVQCKVNF